MRRHVHTIVIGGGCLGVAAAISMSRRHGASGPGGVALIEKAVLGAGLSSRHSAIVRSANASLNAAKLALQSTYMWQNLEDIWGSSIAYEQVGAVWIGAEKSELGRQNSWSQLETSMAEAGIRFSQIDLSEVTKLTDGKMLLNPEELYFHEPGVIQMEASEILRVMQSSIKNNNIDLYEHTKVEGFLIDGQGLISGVRTSQGDIYGEVIINASGGWSADLFASLGITIPVALEPVYAANWLISSSDLPEKLPIIADYENLAYFRRWRGSILHMHQPRKRGSHNIAASFRRSSMNPAGADIIYDASNYAVTQQQLENYSQKVRNRFPSVGRPIYGGGYVSYFDITADLKFILGADNKVKNLFHVLGSGQALKFAPVFGELIADLIENGESPLADVTEFSIARFENIHFPKFWLENGSAQMQNSL